MNFIKAHFLAILALLVCYCGIGVIATAQAQTILLPELYRADMPVEDSSAKSRNDAFRQGLIKVLVRLSGSRTIEHMPEVEPILARAAKYALGYSYSHAEEGQETEPVLLLRIEFDGQALERALHKAGLPVWAAKRPAVMVWLAMNQGSNRYIVAEDSETKAKEYLKQAATERGVPLLMPLMDLEDRRHVEFGDIRAGFFDALTLAAARYNTNIMLIGVVQKASASSWSVKWTVQRDNTSSSWREDDVSLTEAVRSGVEGLADILASRYAFSSTPDGQLNQYVIAIGQLMNLDQYATVLNLMQDMIFIEQVTPFLVEPDQAAFKVVMRGSLAELEKSLLLSNRLLPATAENVVAPSKITEKITTDLQFILYR